MRKDLLIKICVVIICSFPFISYLIGSISAMLIFIIALIISSYLISHEKKMTFQKENFLWILCIVLMLVSIFYSMDKYLSLKFAINFSLMILIKIILENKYGWEKVAEKSIIIFSTIHVIATFIYQFNPDIIQGICRKILNANQLQVNFNAMRFGSNSGITGEPGYNAFLITAFIAIFFSRYITGKKHKTINLICLLIGVFAIFLTGKRGLLIANIVAMVVLVFILGFQNKSKIIMYIISFSLVAIIGYNILVKIPEANIVLERFQRNIEAGDITNGRVELYEIMINNIKNKFFFGNGIKSTVILTGGNDGHNIYLQLFSELGIVGLVTFSFAFIISLFKSIKIASIINKFKEKQNFVSQSIYIQIFFLIYGITGNPLFNISIFAFYIIMIAMNNSIIKEINLINSKRGIN